MVRRARDTGRLFLLRASRFTIRCRARCCGGAAGPRRTRPRRPKCGRPRSGSRASARGCDAVRRGSKPGSGSTEDAPAHGRRRVAAADARPARTRSGVGRAPRSGSSSSARPARKPPSNTSRGSPTTMERGEVRRARHPVVGRRPHRGVLATRRPRRGPAPARAARRRRPTRPVACGRGPRRPGAPACWPPTLADAEAAFADALALARPPRCAVRAGPHAAPPG